MTNDAKSALTPKLRFPEFRDQPGWDLKRGDDLFDQASNREAPAGLPILAITQEHGAIPRDEIDYHVSVTDKSVETYKEVCPGDFIISLRSFQGGIEYSNHHGICSPAYVILRKKAELVDTFFKHLFKSHSFIQQLTKNLEGLRDGKMISYKQFSELLLPYTSPAEQQKIAEFLSTLDELIGAESEKLEALKAYKKGLMQRLFPREGETLPRFRFPEFQDAPEWGCNELSTYLKQVIDYRGKAPPKSSSGVPLITAKNVRLGWLDMSNDEYIEADQYEMWMVKGIPNPGDILFTTEAPLGNVARFPSGGRFALGQRIITLQTDTRKCVPDFLFQALLSPAMQKAIDFHSTGSAAKGIKSSVFVTIKMSAPQIDEQQRVANCLSSLDELIAAQTDKLEVLKSGTKGLMQQLFPSPVEAVE